MVIATTAGGDDSYKLLMVERAQIDIMSVYEAQRICADGGVNL
jgi:hypothetical protein